MYKILIRKDVNSGWFFVSESRSQALKETAMLCTNYSPDCEYGTKEKALEDINLLLKNYSLNNIRIVQKVEFMISVDLAKEPEKVANLSTEKFDELKIALEQGTLKLAKEKEATITTSNGVVSIEQGR